MKKGTKLWVIPHDGTLQGDSRFYPPDPRFLYRKGMSIKDVRDFYGKWARERDEYATEEDITDHMEAVKGAWVVDEKAIRVLDASVIECGNDSACYTANRVRKTMLNGLAVRFIGEKPR